MEPVDINGVEPAIVGDICEALVAVEYIHDGKLVEAANVVFLRFSNQWHRLYFDFGIVFWRTDPVGPKAFVAPEIDSEFRVVDLGERLNFRGRRLLEVTYAPLPNDGSAVGLRFDDKRTITFRSVDDITTYAITSAV